MSFKDLELQGEYRSLSDNVVEEFYIPVLQESVLYKRAVGFFSSSALVELTKGIAGLLKNDGKIQIVASPYLSEEDKSAIDEGYKKRDEIIQNNLLRSLENVIDEYEIERLNLLANLIATNRLEVKIAFVDDENGIGMYHEKMGLMYDKNENIIAFSGSMNESANAFSHNYEAIDVFTSWEGEHKRVAFKEVAFESIWNNQEPRVKTIEYPNIGEEIIRRYKRDNQIDFSIDKRQFLVKERIMEKKFMQKPERVTIRKYQEEAIEHWETANYRGIFDMATGTGKTYTALAALERLMDKKKKVAVFVVCPYIHLVNQWEEDAEEWGISSIIAHSQSTQKDWKDKLIRSYKRFRKEEKSFMCIVSNDTFQSETIQMVIEDISPNMNALLVVDEVHNFGAVHLSEYLSEHFQFRLGLSATVERFLDKKGTEKLFDYFGNKCIEYSLERAIRERALVEYEYYPIIVPLQEEELEEYKKLTKQLGRFITKKNGKVKISDSGQQILFKRSRLVAGAENKMELLKEYIEPYKNEKHILVYCGATRGFEEYPGQKERQIDRVGEMIGKDLNMVAHKFTAEENAKKRKLLKEGFADGQYQVLTAIKCLDEGVNIPNIHIAFIMASSRNPKEFIQRRGRVLRRAEGKNRAIIYDFVTLPRELYTIRYGDIEEDRSLVMGELARIYEFGRYSVNSRVADDIMYEIETAYNLNIVHEDLEKYMEDEDGKD